MLISYAQYFLKYGIKYRGLFMADRWVPREGGVGKYFLTPGRKVNTL